MGEVRAGFMLHAFTTPDYLRDVTVPALLDGRLADGNESFHGFTVAGPANTGIRTGPSMGAW